MSSLTAATGLLRPGKMSHIFLLEALVLEGKKEKKKIALCMS